MITRPPRLTAMIRSLLILLFSSSMCSAPAAEYLIDPAHTYASFEIDHLGFSTQRGQFNRSSGSIEYDPEQRSGRIDIRIDAASLDTGLDARDTVLRGEDWFDTQAFPDILFRSQKLIFSDDRLSAVEGQLVLRGQIRPIRLDIVRFKCGLNLVNRKRGCGADAQASLRRSDFGLANGIPFVGDEVRVRIQVEAYLP